MSGLSVKNVLFDLACSKHYTRNFFNYIVCFYIYDLFVWVFFFPLGPHRHTNAAKAGYMLNRNVDKITRNSPRVDSVVRSMAHDLYENSVDRLPMKYFLFSVLINACTTTAPILFDKWRIVLFSANLPAQNHEAVVLISDLSNIYNKRCDYRESCLPYDVCSILLLQVSVG